MPHRAIIHVRAKSTITGNPPDIKVEAVHGNGPGGTHPGNQWNRPSRFEFNSDDNYVKIKFTKVDPDGNIWDTDIFGAGSDFDFKITKTDTDWQLTIPWSEGGVSTRRDSSTTNVEISTNQ